LEWVDQARLVLALAFREGQDFPALAVEAAAVFSVAVFVAGEFGEPVFSAGGGDAAAAAAGVHVPEAAADVDDFSSGGEDEVGGAGEGFDVEAVAVAEGMDEAADE